MEAPLNTSVFLAIMVALWLIWVAPYVLRLRKVRVSAVAMAEDAPKASAFLEMATMSRTSEKPRPQEAAMTGTLNSSASKQAEAAPQKQAFKVRYDRTALAAIGALALLTALLGAVLAVAGAVSGWLPVVAVVVFAACLGSLRLLAINDRKKRVERAFRAAMSSTPIVASKAVPASLKPASADVTVSIETISVSSVAQTELFDAEPTAPEAKDRQVKPLTAAELRQAALAVADGAEVKADGTWEPVPVPKPSYVEAPKAERPAPEPLELPETPKPSTKTSIKQAEAGVSAPAAKRAGTTGAALNNLDDVLQRRRA